MSDAPAPVAPVVVSPTGTPSLGQTLTKVAVPVFALIGAVAGLPEIGINLPYAWWPVVVGVAKALLGLGVALGIASAGARKAPAEAGKAAAADPGKVL